MGNLVLRGLTRGLARYVAGVARRDGHHSLDLPNTTGVSIFVRRPKGWILSLATI